MKPNHRTSLFLDDRDMRNTVLATLSIALALQLQACSVLAENPSARHPGEEVIMVGVVGAGLLALVAARVWPSGGRASAPETPEPTVKAAELINTAIAAARAGDCATVIRLDPEVQRLDADFYEAVFLGELAIARCLAKPTRTKASKPSNAPVDPPTPPGNVDPVAAEQGAEPAGTLIDPSGEEPVTP